MDVDLGKVAINRLPELLGVKHECAPRETGFCWTLWGAVQRAWAEPAADRGYPAWTLQLRTPALAQFSGSSVQSAVLSARLQPPTLSGIVLSDDQPDRLELASRIEVHRGNISWVPHVLAVAARIQAAESRRLSESIGLRWVGLMPAINSEAEIPRGFVLNPAEALLSGLGSELMGTVWPETEIARCVDVLKQQARADAVRTVCGMTATLLLAGARGSILDIKTDAAHPMLGRGLLVVLRTPTSSGLMNALAMNALEVGPEGSGAALGGWWATPEGVLKYTGFYPDALYRKEFAVDLLLGYARRAHWASLR